MTCALAFVVVEAVNQLQATWAGFQHPDEDEMASGFIGGAHAVLEDLERLIGQAAMDALIPPV